MIGAQAVTQAIDSPCGVAADGAGGFYVSSQIQNRIYRVAADARRILRLSSIPKIKKPSSGSGLQPGHVCPINR
jgi:hypothetical protein